MQVNYDGDKSLKYFTYNISSLWFNNVISREDKRMTQLEINLTIYTFRSVPFLIGPMFAMFFNLSKQNKNGKYFYKKHLTYIGYSS